MMQSGEMIAASNHGTRRVEFFLVTSSMALTLAAWFSPIALALVAGGAVLLLAGMRFRPLLLAIVLFMPVNPYLNWDLPIRDLQTLLRFCFFAGTVLARKRSAEPLWPWFFSGRITRALLGYFVVAVIAATVFNPPTGAAARELMRLASYLCFYYAVIDWLRTENDVKAILHVVLIATIVVTLFGFYQFILGDYSSLYEALYPIQDEALKNPPWAGRITSFLSHYNGLAAYLNMVVPVCIGLGARAKEKFSRVLGWTCLVFASVALVLTQSRGGLLAYVVILLVSAYLLPRTRMARLRWTGAVLVFSVSGALIAGQIFTRLQGVDSYTEVTRLGIWAGAGLLFAGSPVMGVGYGNFKTALTYAIAVPDGYMLDAHNLYLELLAETGIIGFATFAILIFTCLRCARRMFRASERATASITGFAVVAAIAGVLVHGMVEYVFHNSPQCAAMFFLLLSLVGAHELRASTALQTRSTGHSAQLSTPSQC